MLASTVSRMDAGSTTAPSRGAYLMKYPIGRIASSLLLGFTVSVGGCSSSPKVSFIPPELESTDPDQLVAILGATGDFIDGVYVTTSKVYVRPGTHEIRTKMFHPDPEEIYVHRLAQFITSRGRRRTGPPDYREWWSVYSFEGEAGQSYGIWDQAPVADLPDWFKDDRTFTSDN